MTVTVTLPQKIEAQLRTKWGENLPRKVLEALAVEGYLCGDLSLGEVAELLDLSVNDADGFLKKRGVPAISDLSEIQADSQTLEKLLDK